MWLLTLICPPLLKEVSRYSTEDYFEINLALKYVYNNTTCRSSAHIGFSWFQQ